MLGGTREFRYGCVLLRDRHLPLLSCALMMEVGPVIGAANFRGKQRPRYALGVVHGCFAMDLFSIDSRARRARQGH